jgi:hypothetical protein
LSFVPPERPRPSSKKYYLGVLPDLHAGYVIDTPTYSIPAWDIAMQALWHNLKRLTHIVILGDFGNFESVSHWASLRADQTFIEEDVALCLARIEEIEALNVARKKLRLPPIRVIFCEGNHEVWAAQIEAKYPQLRNMVNLQNRLGFKRAGWTWVPENHFWAIGEIYFTHGHIRGNRKPGDLCRTKGVSVIQGHDHTYRTASVRTLKGELAQWSFGCLASIDPPPPYARGEQPSSWVHGLGFVQVRANGRFQVSYRRIIDEAWTELEDGTEIRVDGKACQRRYDADQRIRDQLREEYGERFYAPDGPIVRTEPHHGKTDQHGNVSPVARTRRARIIRSLPDIPGGASR